VNFRFGVLDTECPERSIVLSQYSTGFEVGALKKTSLGADFFYNTGRFGDPESEFFLLSFGRNAGKIPCHVWIGLKFD